MATRRTVITAVAIISALGAASAVGTNRWSNDPPLRTVAGPRLVRSDMAGTSRAELERAAATLKADVQSRAGDADAVVALADVLLRLGRATANAGHAIEAGAQLDRILANDPSHTAARRMLAAVQLSQHRFRDAIASAERALQSRPDDPWLHGIVGDARLELGEYDAAFASFERMLAARPDASSYARASYARELQGDLAGAIRTMQMAVAATSAQDVEAMAWTRSQLGHLYVASGRLADARREYNHSAFIFPGYVLAREGLAHVAAAEDPPADALRIVQALNASAPSPTTLALAGDLHTRLGQHEAAAQQYRLAEAAWESDASEPAQLALFLAERGRRLDDAVAIAERAHAERDDIFTNDALAWAYFKQGRIRDAHTASLRALRTNTADVKMRQRAATIARAATTTRAAARMETSQ